MSHPLIPKDILFDEEDRWLMIKHKWRINSQGYVITYFKNKKLYLHREITNSPKDLHVDHQNGNKLDNRKENLRICTRNQNLANSKLAKNNSCGLKGVSYRIKEGKWEAQLSLNNDTVHLGLYNSKEEAHAAYRGGAIVRSKEFARFK